jgi:uncharacterized RDD family membrane protein YckC
VDRPFEDTITISTPEGVELELTLAGAGSRFVSALADLAIQVAILAAAGLALGGLDVLGGVPASGAASAAVYAVVSFAVVAGYDICFEVLASGRTPGKRLNRLRVVRSGGEPVGFVTSGIRNTLRLVDFLPFAYVLGAVTILATRRNQRLGDLAAGTLVVREGGAATIGRSVVDADPAPPAVSWDTSGVTAAETAAVRRFLERRREIDPSSRRELARTFASRLRPKVAGMATDVGDEEFLTLLVAAKSRRGG